MTKLEELNIKREFLDDIKWTGALHPGVYKRFADNLDREMFKERRIAAMRESLESAIREAGGDVSSIIDKVEKGLTVEDLMEGLGPNGVRFTYEG